MRLLIGSLELLKCRLSFVPGPKVTERERDDDDFRDLQTSKTNEAFTKFGTEGRKRKVFFSVAIRKPLCCAFEHAIDSKGFFF